MVGCLINPPLLAESEAQAKENLPHLYLSRFRSIAEICRVETSSLPLHIRPKLICNLKKCFYNAKMSSLICKNLTFLIVSVSIIHIENRVILKIRDQEFHH